MNAEKQPESLAAILAEMRDGIHTGRADIIDCVNDRLRSYADRIEAAAERERIAHTNDIHDALYMATGIPGNVAAMREALESAHRTLKLVCEHAGEFVQPRLAEEIIHSGAAVERALAAPARNCDRFATAEEARRAFESAHSHGIVRNHYTAAFDWLFAPAEGGAK